MRKRSEERNKIDKRSFLAAGACGACALGVAGLVAGGRGAGAQTTPDTGAHIGRGRKGLIKTRRSPWFTSLENRRVRCDLCPRGCELAEGQRGRCRVRENRAGELYSLTFGNPALVQLDPVERKPFFHVLPGTRALSISTAGCNLACKFCEVWDMALVGPEEVYAYDLPPENVIEQAQEAGAHSISYAFGEPVVFYEYMDAVATQAREAGLLNLVHTAGTISDKPLRALCKTVDAVNVDLKSFNADFYRDVCDGRLEPVLNTLKVFREEGVHVEITHIVIPTLNDDRETARKMCAWIVDELGPDTPIHFARFYPLYKLANLPPTPVSTLDDLRRIARDQGLNFVYVARVTGHEGENTFCPACGEKVIRRMGFVVEDVNLNDGHCAECGAAIPGRWGV